MYTIPVASVLKFFSNEYMPVFTNDAVRTNAVTGEIDKVVINSAGTGYNNGTYDNVAINGDGTGGRVSVVVDGGKLLSATVTSGGTGYTFGKISVDSITGIGTGTGGQVDVIIPPPGGHGSDSVVELGAFRVMINAKLSYNEGAGDFPIDNDYRRIGLITNPLKFGTEELISDLTALLQRQRFLLLPSKVTTFLTKLSLKLELLAVNLLLLVVEQFLGTLQRKF